LRRWTPSGSEASGGAWARSQTGHTLDVASGMDGFEMIRQMREAVERGEPLVFVPIDDEGNECGPSEAIYAAPDGPQLN
jgi:hypothetical protein